MVRNEGHVRGELSEFKVASDLVERGCRVSYTHGQYPYDLIADLDGQILKTQVKTANHMDRRKYQLLNLGGYNAADVDLFAGYAPDPEDTIVYVPFDKAGDTFRVTFTPADELSDHNEEQAILAEDHTFDDAISSLSAN